MGTTSDNAGATLWLVATPIGNLGDLAPRAIEVLAAAALVACEDTRRTRKLLTHAGIRAERLVVANEHTEYDVIEQVLDTLGAGGDVAVVSDAGTPGISDPGERLATAAITAGHPVSAVPGPTAAIMALTISGLPTDRFCFEGFIPRKGNERRERLTAIANETRTVVIYEAPHRILKTLDALRQVCGPDRTVVVCRELTKRHETVVRGTLGAIDIGEPRGEYVLVLAGRSEATGDVSDADIAAALRRHDNGGRDAVVAVATELGVPKNRVYRVHRTSAEAGDAAPIPNE